MTASGTSTYLGLYKARCTADSGLALSVYVPQVFGTQAISITDMTGARPATGSWGYVTFEGGDPGFPIWVSAGGNGSGAVTTIISGGGGGSGDLDGGRPDSIYGGIDPVIGGTP